MTGIPLILQKRISRDYIISEAEKHIIPTASHRSVFSRDTSTFYPVIKLIASATIPTILSVIYTVISPLLLP